METRPDPTGPSPDSFADAIVARVREAVREELAGQGAPPLLDLPGVAARLNVSKRTVEALVAAGELPVVRIGAGPRTRGVRRFDPAAVDAFIRRRARQL